MGTAIKVLRSLIHNTVVYIYLHSYKINILICDTKICWISKETLMHNSDTLHVKYICHSIVKLLYIWEGENRNGISIMKYDVL